MKPYRKKAILLLCGVLMSLSACKATSEKQVDRIGDDEQKPITKSEAIQIVDDDTENDSLSAVLQPSEWDIL